MMWCMLYIVGMFSFHFFFHFEFWHSFQPFKVMKLCNFQRDLVLTCILPNFIDVLWDFTLTVVSFKFCTEMVGNRVCWTDFQPYVLKAVILTDFSGRFSIGDSKEEIVWSKLWHSRSENCRWKWNWREISVTLVTGLIQLSIVQCQAVVNRVMIVCFH